ncbi:hypothetical protein GWI33_018928 [Rhynchophorus ferrugineus]|uniref:Uncharacterized protein n=1 Tax=Rhynchophorus ferrugineus TaxID=354439 RepID=A0A834M0Z5_RHYFE|nr:hypothetical protein GWI33_018928 [Rhynchophorus ferrugineus]
MFRNKIKPSLNTNWITHLTSIKTSQCEHTDLFDVTQNHEKFNNTPRYSVDRSNSNTNILIRKPGENRNDKISETMSCTWTSTAVALLYDNDNDKLYFAGIESGRPYRGVNPKLLKSAEDNLMRTVRFAPWTGKNRS